MKKFTALAAVAAMTAIAAMYGSAANAGEAVNLMGKTASSCDLKKAFGVGEDDCLTEDERTARAALQNGALFKRGDGKQYRGLSVKAPPARKVALTVTFEFDSATLTPDALQQLDEVADFLNDPRNSGQTYQLVGHTDSKGADGYNQRLSERRAAAVAAYLERQRNVDPGRIIWVGKGESELWDPARPDDRANRRVEIVRVTR